MSKGKIVFWCAIGMIGGTRFVFHIVNWNHAWGEMTPVETIAVALSGAMALLAGALGPRVLSNAGYWLRVCIGMAGIAQASLALWFLAFPMGDFPSVRQGILYCLPVLQIGWVLAALVWRAPDGSAVREIRRSVRRELANVTGPLLEALVLAIKVLAAVCLAAVPWVNLPWLLPAEWLETLASSADHPTLPFVFMLMSMLMVRETLRFAACLGGRQPRQFRLCILEIGVILVVAIFLTTGISNGGIVAACLTIAVMVLGLWRIEKMRRLDIASMRRRIFELLRQNPSPAGKAFYWPFRQMVTADEQGLAIEGPMERVEYPWGEISHIASLVRGEQILINGIGTRDGKMATVWLPAALEPGQLEEIWDRWERHIDQGLTEFHAFRPPTEVLRTPMRLMVRPMGVVWVMCLTGTVIALLDGETIYAMQVIVLALLSGIVPAVVWLAVRAQRRGVAAVRTIDGGIELTYGHGECKLVMSAEILSRRLSLDWIHTVISTNRNVVYSLSYWPVLRRTLLGIVAQTDSGATNL